MSLGLFQQLDRYNWPHLLLLLALSAWLCQPWLPLGSEAMALVWLLFSLAWLAFWEWQRPAEPTEQATAAEWRRDGVFLLLNGVADKLAGLLPLLLALPHLASRPSGPGEALLAIVLAELGAYLYHRASHLDGPLWRIHRLHHLPDKLNLANSVLAHPLNALLTQVSRVLPLYLLGFSEAAVLAAALFGQTQAFAVHSNIRGTLGWLNGWLGSHELHRLHHSVDLALAGNFGTSLPVWDRLFASYRAPQPAGALGVAGQALPATWCARLCQFRSAV